MEVVITNLAYFWEDFERIYSKIRSRGVSEIQNAGVGGGTQKSQFHPWGTFVNGTALRNTAQPRVFFRAWYILVDKMDVPMLFTII
jgi:hypothetical protein